MKRLILLLLLIPYLGFSQEQITDLSRNAIYKTDFSVIGEIGISVYVLQPNNGIFRVTSEDTIASQIVRFPYGRLYGAMISHDRLFFFNDGNNQDSSRVYEVNPETQTYELIYGEKDVYSIRSGKDALYLTFTSGIRKISFDEFPYKLEKSEMAYITGDVNSYELFSYRDSLGFNQTRFMDKEGNEYMVENINYSISQYEEFTNYVIVSVYPYSANFYVFDKIKKEFKRLPDFLNQHSARLQFFENKGDLFVLSSNQKNTQNGVIIPMKYSVHKFIDGEPQTLFDTELNTNHIYAVSQHMAMHSLYYGYSNVVMKDSVVYFWANDSDKSSEAGQLKLYSINLITKQISSKSINDQNVSLNLKLTKPPYSLQLSVHNGRIVTHVLQSNYFSFDYNINTQDFAFTKKPYHKAIYPLKNDRVLNFSFKDRLLVQNLNTHEYKELKAAQNQMPVSDYDIYRKEKVILIDEMNGTFHYFDGESLTALNHDISKDFKSVYKWKCMNPTGLDYALIWAGGLTHDGTFEGAFYTVNHSLKKIEKVYSYKHEQYFFDDMYYSFSGNMVMAKFSNEQAVLVNVSTGKTIIYEKEVPMDGVELLHSFNDKKFLISDYDRMIFFDGKNKKIVGSNQLIHNRFIIGNLFYVLSSNRLYTIDENGVYADVLTNLITTGNSYIKFDETEFLFVSNTFTTRINKNTGKISKVGTPSGNPFFTSYAKAGNDYYGFSKDGVYKLDFDKETITKIEGIRLLNEGAVRTAGSSAYFYGEAGNNKRTIVRLKGNNFSVFGNFTSQYIPGDFSQPQLFTDNDDKFLWIPENELLKKLDSTGLEEEIYSNFISQSSDTIQLTVGYNKFTFLRITKAGAIVENRVLNSRPHQHPVSSKMENSLYTFINNEGMWKTDSTGFRKINNLETSNTFFKQNFFVMRGNLYAWAKDTHGIAQIFRVTDNPNGVVEDEITVTDSTENNNNILLTTENPNINFSFYPNPTQDYLNVTSTLPKAQGTSENTYKVTLFTDSGKVISERQLTLPQQLDLAGLKTGVYFINLKSETENKTFRVVKQ